MSDQEEKNEHDIVLKTAKDILEDTRKSNEAGRKRLMNALKKYEERGKSGITRRI